MGSRLLVAALLLHGVGLLATICATTPRSAPSAPQLRGPSSTEADLLAVLSRAATVSGFLNPNVANTTDMIRMLVHTGATYAGRSVFVWGGEGAIPSMLPHVKSTAAAVHAATPDLILEGGVFEIVTVRQSPPSGKRVRMAAAPDT